MRKFSGIKLLKKQLKSEQKSEWTYVHEYVIKKYITELQ